MDKCDLCNAPAAVALFPAKAFQVKNIEGKVIGDFAGDGWKACTACTDDARAGQKARIVARAAPFLLNGIAPGEHPGLFDMLHRTISGFFESADIGGELPLPIPSPTP
jgi:hypothetical protein